VAATYISLPWGDGYSATVNNAGGDQDNEHFAGLERDAESGTEHAQFRNYASAQGRWLGPDPYMGSYDLTNPQSMNRYSYALNNPLSLVDPSGLEVCAECFDDGGGDGGDGGGAGDDGGEGGGGNQPNCASDNTVCVTATPPAAPDPCDSVDCFPGASNPSGPSNDGVRGTPNAPSKGTFTKTYLPPGAQNCSAILNFNAPPGFNLNAMIAAGRTGGLNPFAALAAVGHNGTFDFQRSSSGGNTTFYSGYTDASNIAVGAYLYGAGFSNGQASFISNSFANTMSSNAGSPQQSDYRNLGYDLAAAGWNPSCH
jgi:RHS repeat-associated protein